MWIKTENVFCRVVKADDDEQEWLQKYLSFADSSWMGKQRGGRVSLYSTLRGLFPGGLLPLVQDAAQRDGVKIELMEGRTSVLVSDPTADLAWLRDYQLEAVNACVTARRGIVRAPTGSGKTEIFVGLTKAMPGRWLMLVHRDTLVDQAAERYRKRTGGRIPNVMSRTEPSTWKLVSGFNAMTLQTLAAALRKDKPAVERALADCQGLVVDECHVAPADVYFNAIQKCPAEFRLGFSGTPLDRTDNRSLMAIAALGKVIYSVKAQTLIDAGVLAMPRITMVPVEQKLQSGLGGASGWHEKYEILISESEVRNARIVEIVQEATKPCMVFVKLIDHGKALTRMLERAGLRTEFVWGATKDRRGAIERLERRDADVMVASVVFQEGVDIPSLESVVIASAGKSIIATLQRIGRGMRTNGGMKTSFEVFDILDTGVAMMEAHSRRRMNTYVREGYQTIIQKADGTLVGYAPKLRTRKEKRQMLTGK